MNRRLFAIAAACAVTPACSDGRLDAFARLGPDGAPTAGAGSFQPGGDAAGGDGARSASAEGGGESVKGGAGDGGGEAEANAGAAAISEEALLLDDFEDGDQRGLGATGDWYVVNDKTGTQTVAVEALVSDRGGNAMHTGGKGFSDWGAKLGLDLSLAEPVLDASSFGKLVFLARVEPGSLGSLRVVLIADGSHYGRDIELTETWQRYSVAFSELRLPDGTGHLDAARLTHLEFFAEPVGSFDYWFDDVALEP